EQVKQKQVHRSKDTDHRRLQQQQQDVILFLSFLNVFPGRQRRDNAEQRGQNDQQDGNAVNTHLITRADDRDPLVVFQELHAAGAAVVSQQEERDEKVERKPAGRKLLDQA